MVNKVIVNIYRAEYYDAHKGWIKFYEDTDVENVRFNLDNPIFGKPMVRLVKYERTGKRSFKYRLLEVLEKREGR